MTADLELAVQRYLRELSPESRTRLLETYAHEVEEFSHLAYRIVETLQLYHAQDRTHNPTDPKQAAFSLMTKAANGLMAGFELAIGGYGWEPAVVYRSVFEAFAVAWDIVHNTDRFAHWRANKNFDSTASISKLKKEIEPAGQLYGYLSNMHVHTSPITARRKCGSPEMS